MQLEAKSVSCFSSQFVLRLNGRPSGKFQGRWFSRSLYVDLSERRHLQFHHAGWLGSGFELVDPADDRLLGSCKPSGFLTSSWDLDLSCGAGHLQRAGWLTSAYECVQDDEVRARVDRIGGCERGWFVDGDDGLASEDLLLIGLVYHALQQRQASHKGQIGGAAG